MPVRRPHLETRATLVSCLLVLSSAAVRAADPAPAGPTADSAVAELPSFKPGLWEYRRTLVSGQSPKPQVSTVRKCIDPATDIREKMAELKKKNCQFAPLRKNNDHYVSSWICPSPNGPMRFRDVLIVKDLTSYQDVSETHSSQHVTEQKIEATRLGECPGLGTGAPMTPTPKPKPPPGQP